MFKVCSSLTSLPVRLPVVGLHTTAVLNSRIKRVSRHKAMWHIKKLNKAEDEPVMQENKQFLAELLAARYAGPLRAELAPWPRGDWQPWSRRCGVLAVKIGVQPLWLSSGRQIMTTLLHVTDNHVVKFTPRADYEDSYMGNMNKRPNYLGPTKEKHASLTGFLTIGSHSTDPQRFTKDYCGLFTESGVMPKRHLARFPVTENAVIQPGTPLTASHFSVGQWVDVFGRTQERGFHGVMKRWGFRGMPATHGQTKTHRRPGNIGNKNIGVQAGKKMPGNVGGGFTWNCGLRVWRINHAESVLYVSGVAVQGKTGSVVQVCDTRIPGHRWEALQRGPDRFPTAFSECEAELAGEEWQQEVHQFGRPSITF